MPRSLAMLVLLLACSALAPRPAHAGWNPFLEAKATGQDAVTTPGHTVQLTAKFERSLRGYFARDLEGAKVAFYVDGVFSGEVFTGKGGVAQIAYRPSQAGAVGITARLVDRKWKKTAAQATLFVLPQRPTLVFDIDGTLSSMPEWKVPLLGGTARTFDHAPAVLRSLAKDFEIVYLTARDDALAGKTRAFLARHGFPKGPVLYNQWDLGITDRQTLAGGPGIYDSQGLPNEGSQLDKKNHGKFKLRVIRELQARGVKFVAGVGDSDTDGYAHENANLVSFLRNGTGIGPRPGSIYFADYRHLESYIRTIGRTLGWI